MNILQSLLLIIYLFYSLLFSLNLNADEFNLVGHYSIVMSEKKDKESVDVLTSKYKMEIIPKDTGTLHVKIQDKKNTIITFEFNKRTHFLHLDKIYIKKEKGSDNFEKQYFLIKELLFSSLIPNENVKIILKKQNGAESKTELLMVKDSFTFAEEYSITGDSNKFLFSGYGRLERGIKVGEKKSNRFVAKIEKKILYVKEKNLSQYSLSKVTVTFFSPTTKLHKYLKGCYSLILTRKAKHEK